MITTYQSLLRDLKREEKDRLFKPDEFSLAVFDEAHALTGEHFGLTAKQFEGKAVRLAFTATPDRSEEKTLKTHFPHRYYHLTSGEAMKAGTSVTYGLFWSKPTTPSIVREA